VRLLLPGKTDVPVARHAGHGFYTSLLRRGVRIFEYQPSILHAKTLVADSYVSVVGSTNLDFRSFLFNSECNLVMLCPQTAGKLEEAFLADLEKSTEVEVAIWRDRPWHHRLGDRMARLLAPVL
jgi:cardiolipin synthase